MLALSVPFRQGRGHMKAAARIECHWPQPGLPIRRDESGKVRLSLVPLPVGPCREVKAPGCRRPHPEVLLGIQGDPR